ncbi:hypothetical protein BUE80_DR007669 [Diplocarpon rosae]|nr:hypothetical protein BUE80_DR007669 [Diplocarpon rosae]
MAKNKKPEVIRNDTHDTVTACLHLTARYYRGHLHTALRLLIDAEADTSQGVTSRFRDRTIATADLLPDANRLHPLSDQKLSWSSNTDSSQGAKSAFVPGFKHY